MLKYTLLLHGFQSPSAGLPGALLRDLLDAVDRSAKGAVRLRLEGRSSAQGGFPPAWVHAATAFQVEGFHHGVPGVELRVPTLGEALPERFAREDLSPPVDPGDSALTLMGRSLREALEGNADSDAYDQPLLRSFEEFRDVFRHGVEAVEIGNERPDSSALRITPRGIEAVARLHRQTPRPRRMRLAGRVDAIRHSDRAFRLVLRSGEPVRGVLADGDPEELARYSGGIAVVSGSAHYRPSGSLLRVEAEHLSAGSEEDIETWSIVPGPLDVRPDAHRVRQPRGARGGIDAIFGKWPGDETDEEIFRMLEEIS